MNVGLHRQKKSIRFAVIKKRKKISVDDRIYENIIRKTNVAQMLIEPCVRKKFVGLCACSKPSFP